MVFITGKGVGSRLKTIEPIVGANPKYVVGIFHDAADIVITDAIAIPHIIAVDRDLVAVVPVEAIAGAQPDKSSLVLEDGFNGAVGQSLLAGNMLEPEFGALGESPLDAAAAKEQEQEEVFEID